MTIIQKVNPHLNSLNAPTQLKALQGWLVWRFEQVGNEAKPRKVPYYVNGARRFGVNGSPKDIEQLSSFAIAKRTAAARGFDGVGFALLKKFGITALDFDNCVSPAGIDSQVESMVSGTYAEYSPSGKGIRAFICGSLGDCKSHGTVERPIGFETFSSKGYVTFTGDVLEITDITGSNNTLASPSDLLLSYFATRFLRQQDTSNYLGTAEPIIGLSQDQITHVLSVLPSDMSYDDWLKVGMALHHETSGEGFELWENWSLQSPKYSTREYNAQRWDSFGRSDGRHATARGLVRLANEHGAQLAIDIALPTEFSVIPPDPLPAGGHFKIRSATDFMQSVKPVSWLIKGVLPHATLGLLYGESGSGKSFLAFNVCAALGRGIEWNGIRTRKSRVLYVVAEGVGGFNQRVRAYCHQEGVEPSVLGIDIISDVTPNLTEPSHVNKLIEDIKHFGPYDLIVMDTFAQVTPGANENSGEDMGKALAYCKKISQVSGAMVLLVHHSGKDASRGARGWSGMHAAADVVLEVTRFENDRAVSVAKQKDGRDGAEYGFRLLDVVLGEDEDGDDITSCIVEYGQAHVAKKRVKVKGPKGRIERAVLKVAHDLAGLSADGKVPQTDLIDASVAQIPHDSGKRDQRRGCVLRAIESLGMGDFFEIQEGYVLLNKGEEK